MESIIYVKIFCSLHKSGTIILVILAIYGNIFARSAFGTYLLLFLFLFYLLTYVTSFIQLKKIYINLNILLGKHSLLKSSLKSKFKIKILTIKIIITNVFNVVIDQPWQSFIAFSFKIRQMFYSMTKWGQCSGEYLRYSFIRTP